MNSIYERLQYMDKNDYYERKTIDLNGKDIDGRTHIKLNSRDISG